MKLPVLLVSIAVQISPQNEKEILQIFERTKEIQDLFVKDTIRYRTEAESFEENEFAPAVEKMIFLINKKKCLNCIGPYLESLSYMENSANEDLTDQLKRLTYNYPKLINDACDNLDLSTKKRLEPSFVTAMQHIESEKKIKYSKTEKTILKCFLLKK